MDPSTRPSRLRRATPDAPPSPLFRLMCRHPGTLACRMILLAALVAPSLSAAPPYQGTIFLEPDIITPADPTALVALKAPERGMRQTFDRRVNAWVNTDCFLFTARFSDGSDMEFQVNAEFGTAEAAQAQAEEYGKPIGQMPLVVRSKLESVTIHAGLELYGGGSGNVLIHTGQTVEYNRDGILEETLVHEASHASLDPDHANAPGWVAAQQADGEFISTYARDNPTREDVAETFLLAMAVLKRPERLSTAMRQTIEATVPNRIAYFRDLDLDYSPIGAVTPILARREERWRFSLSRGISGSETLSTRWDLRVLLGVRRHGPHRMISGLPELHGRASTSATHRD